MSDSKPIKINDTKINLDSVLTEPKEKREPKQEPESKSESRHVNEERSSPLIRDMVQKIMRQPVENNTTAIVERPLISIKKFDIEKREKIFLISRYRNSTRFGEYLRNEMRLNLDMTELQRLSTDELDNLLQEIQICICNKNNQKIVTESAIHIISIFERMLTNLYKVDGISEALHNNDAFLDALEEYALQNHKLLHASPKTIILAEIIKTAVLLHNSHVLSAEISKTPEGKEQLKKFGDELLKKAKEEKSKVQIKNVVETAKPVSQEFVNKYSDLLK